jgi:hypothetical protein
LRIGVSAGGIADRDGRLCLRDDDHERLYSRRPDRDGHRLHDNALEIWRKPVENLRSLLHPWLELVDTHGPPMLIRKPYEEHATVRIREAGCLLREFLLRVVALCLRDAPEIQRLFNSTLSLFH